MAEAKLMAEKHPVRGRPTANQSALITNRIVDAAWQVLLEIGPERFSVDQVAAVAHASKQTIYARFSGKFDLLHAVLSTRIDMLYTEMRELADMDDIQTAFADLARRSIRSMVALETRMLDRLVDWIDAALAEGENLPTRVALYDQAREHIGQLLRHATTRWDIIIDDIPNAAGFWLSGLFGYVRSLPLEGLQHQEWPAIYARYFLRAVCRTAFPSGSKSL